MKRQNERSCHSEEPATKNPEILRSAQNDRIGPAEAAAFLLAHDNYLILTHRRPDGDTIGSAAAPCLGLRAIGKTAWIYENPQFTPKYQPYLEGLVGESSAGPQTKNAAPSCHSEEQSDEESEKKILRCAQNDTTESNGRPMPVPTIISVDVAAPTLFPFGMEEAQVRLAIDHHGSNTLFAENSLVEPDKAACGEIVWSLLKLLDVAPNKAIAEAVYVAVSTDTGCFRYSNVTANTLKVAADCLACGADTYPINRIMFEVKRWPRLELESYLVQTMEFYHEGLVSVSAIPEKVMQELALTEDDVDDISGFGRGIEGVQIAVMLREVEEGGKLSLRCSPDYDASKICRRLGGGGHPAAAGATVDGGIEAAKAAVLAAIEKELTVDS